MAKERSHVGKERPLLDTECQEPRTASLNWEAQSWEPSSHGQIPDLGLFSDINSTITLLPTFLLSV